MNRKISKFRKLLKSFQQGSFRYARLYTNTFKDGSLYRAKFYNVREITIASAWYANQVSDADMKRLLANLRRELRCAGFVCKVTTVTGVGPYYCTSLVVHIKL